MAAASMDPTIAFAIARAHFDAQTQAGAFHLSCPVCEQAIRFSVCQNCHRKMYALSTVCIYCYKPPTPTGPDDARDA